MSENVQDTGKKKRLTPKQRRAIEAFLNGATVGQAAGAAGVTTRTLSRWREQPDFDDELRRRSTRAVRDATRRLTGTLDLSVEVLREVMEDKDETASVRIRAARYVLDAAIKLQELTEVLERLEALEEVVNVGRS